MEVKEKESHSQPPTPHPPPKYDMLGHSWEMGSWNSISLHSQMIVGRNIAIPRYDTVHIDIEVQATENVAREGCFGRRGEGGGGGCSTLGAGFTGGYVHFFVLIQSKRSCRDDPRVGKPP